MLKGRWRSRAASRYISNSCLRPNRKKLKYTIYFSKLKRKKGKLLPCNNTLKEIILIRKSHQIIKITIPKS
jgi:hypothetical protein